MSLSVIHSWAEGTLYEGEWLNGQQAGRGTLTFADARQYVGEWNGGARHGHGTLLYANGSMYGGEWRDGKKWSSMHYDQNKKVLSSFFDGIETPR